MERKLLLNSIAGTAIAGAGGVFFTSAQAACTTSDCFVEAIQDCRPETFETGDPARLGAVGKYSVVGPEEEACRVEFTFSENPNPEWIGEQLQILIDPAAASEEALLDAVESCMLGNDEGYRCEGPLFERMVAEMPQAGGLANGEGPLPCGAGPIRTSGALLYPLPKGGKWGYVDRQGNWQITPQWDRANDFHEGRAAVGSPHAWGIIDRSGDYVLDQQYEGTSTVKIGDQRWVSSPFEPYSEGCTVASIFTDSPQPPFFIDRDGKAYWRHEKPEAIAARDIRAFGGFSEGLSWFQEGQVPDAGYGWIGPSGNVVIEPDFVSAGDFVGGLAPASSREGQAGFISPEGELQLPRKWMLEGAQSFSEGLAPVSTGPFTMAYMNKDGFAFERIALDGGDGGVSEVEIWAAGAFRDDRAPVVIGSGADRELVYVRPDGSVAFLPDEKEGIMVCDARGVPEFRDGLVRLVVADDGENCGQGAFLAGMAEYEKAHYIYLDTDGRIVIRQDK